MDFLASPACRQTPHTAPSSNWHFPPEQPAAGLIYQLFDDWLNLPAILVLPAIADSVVNPNITVTTLTQTDFSKVCDFITLSPVLIWKFKSLQLPVSYLLNV